MTLFFVLTGFVANAMRGELKQSIGATVTYTCNFGYEVGSSDTQIIRCLTSGEWNVEPRNCEGREKLLMFQIKTLAIMKKVLS